MCHEIMSVCNEFNIKLHKIKTWSISASFLKSDLRHLKVSALYDCVQSNRVRKASLKPFTDAELMKDVVIHR